MARIIDLDKENSTESIDKSAIALGNFDGFHLGHRNIIKKAIDVAKEKNIKSSVLIFKQHTNEVFPQFERRYLNSLEDKIENLEKLGIDYIFIKNFTEEFAKLNRDQFMLDFIVGQLNVDSIVCGRDYTFGKKDDANVSHILQYEKDNLLHAYIVADYLYKNSKLSSTLIRDMIKVGKVKEASTILGNDYAIKGQVVHGKKIGSKELGYPTANIDLDFPYVLPAEGVYLTNIYIDSSKYLSLTSIGTNPTVTDSKDLKVEVYILDFNEKIYGSRVKVEFIDWIRGQIKFDSKDKLIKQMGQDLDFALKYKKNNLQN